MPYTASNRRDRSLMTLMAKSTTTSNHPSTPKRRHNRPICVLGIIIIYRPGPPEFIFFVFWSGLHSNYILKMKNVFGLGQNLLWCWTEYIWHIYFPCSTSSSMKKIYKKWLLHYEVLLQKNHFSVLHYADNFAQHFDIRLKKTLFVGNMTLFLSYC